MGMGRSVAKMVMDMTTYKNECLIVFLFCEKCRNLRLHIGLFLHLFAGTIFTNFHLSKPPNSNETGLARIIQRHHPLVHSNTLSSFVSIRFNVFRSSSRSSSNLPRREDSDGPPSKRCFKPSSSVESIYNVGCEMVFVLAMAMVTCVNIFAKEARNAGNNCVAKLSLNEAPMALFISCSCVWGWE